MEVLIFTLFAVCGYLLYRQVKLERRLKEQDKIHKKAIADAGNAITDTLRVAFDNLKRHNAEINKLSGKHTEHQTRIHRSEQMIKQILAKNGRNVSTEYKEENKNEKRNNKTS